MDTPPAVLPPSPNRRTPTRSKPRTPLQERTQSENNEGWSQLGRDGRQERPRLDVFSTTPFPTKPQHILLPSTIRKQKSFRGRENEIPYFFGSQQDGSQRQASLGSDVGSDETRGRRMPVLQLKRSVTTLRDMYEAQADKSRPSTAASHTPRPESANSRLRSVSSTEGLTGRPAWEQLHKISADDMALLPTLSQSSTDRFASESSFAARAMQKSPMSSSPNYRTYASSSSKFPVYRDTQEVLSDGTEPTSSSGYVETISSSPNFVRLGRSSSVDETLDTAQTSSSPNVIKLGTSSPGVRTSSSPTPSVASTGSRKRKRLDTAEDSSFAARARPFTSSPPYTGLVASSSQPSLRSSESVVMPSSPPEPGSARSQSIGTSSPVYRLPGVARRTSGSSSSSSSVHASLQAALSSSPMPPIQYPVVRAPVTSAGALHIPKRMIRSASNEFGYQWESRLSPVPSEWDEGLSRPESTKSNMSERPGSGMPDSDSIGPEPTGNESQIRIIAMSEDDHQHEAIDELGALPRGMHAVRSPPLVPKRTNSLYGTLSTSSASHSQSRLDSLRNSVDTRLNSMKSFSHSRQNSFMSGSVRPTSSGSQSNSVAVPTWARRYYSGFYRDSFQYLYPSQNNSSVQLQVPNTHYPLHRMASAASQLTQPGDSTVTSGNSRRSWQSIRDSLRNSLVEIVPSVLLPGKSRPRLAARKSHLTMGVGPLVSNPVHPDATHVRVDPHDMSPTIRRVSDNLSPVDPRAHWAGVTEEPAMVGRDGSLRHQHSQQFHQHRSSADSESVYYDATSGEMFHRSRFTDMPRLHHDRRLNTGSTRSRGFGFPFNQKPRWTAPSVYGESARPSWFRVDFRDAQVACFILGFVLPLTWFVAAFLPLPHRPESFEDIEKAVYDQQAGEPGDMDVVARLRLERHVKGVEELKWQNARWWKNMNRWMCIVGVVVVVLVVVLAAVGTTNHW